MINIHSVVFRHTSRVKVFDMNYRNVFVMAEYAIKNVVLESNLSRRDRYVVLLFFALYSDIASVLLKERLRNTRKKEVTDIL
jgi:hypothetical protein